MHHMSRFILALCSSLIVFGCATAPTGSVDSSDRFNKALAHYSQGLLYEMELNLDAANRSFEKAIDLDPKHQDSYNRAARNYIRLSAPDKALELTDRLVAQNPKSPDAHLWRAKVSIAADLTDEAEAAYRKALSLDRKNSTAYVELTTVLLSEDREEDAIELLTDGMDRVEDPALLLAHLGHIYLNRASLSTDKDAVIRYRDQAVSLYEQALKKRPTNTKLLQQLGEMYMINQDMENAVLIFTRLVPLTPDDPQPRQKLALALIASGKEEKAVQTLEQLATRDPANPRVYLYLGELYQQLGDHENAILNYRLAAKAGETPMASAYMKLALLQVDGEKEEAEKTLLEATEALPNDIALHEMFAYYYLNLKEYAKAVPVFETTTKLFSSQGITPQPNFFLYHALALQFSGDFEKAAQALESGIAITPELLDAYAQFVLQEREDEAQAAGLKMLTELASRLENSIPAHIYIGLMYNREEQYEKAIESFEKADRLHQAQGDDAEQLSSSFYFWYAAARERLKQFDAAEVLFEKCIQANENHAEAYNYLAYMWAERAANLDKAEVYVNKALALAPENGAFLDTLGWIFYQRGEYDKALLQIEKAATLISDDPTIVEHLGDIALKQERIEDAVHFWKQSYEQNPENKRLREKLLAQGVNLPSVPTEDTIPEEPIEIAGQNGTSVESPASDETSTESISSESSDAPEELPAEKETIKESLPAAE
jgi:tetratricopeptide (TPR) repeat protein